MMKRPVSNSCLVRSSPNKGQSVTILSTEQLPLYSSERFYLLSELEVHASPTCFLCETTEQSSSTEGTAETLESSMDETAISYASFMVLYFFWRPDDTDLPAVFTETLVAAVNSIRDQVELTSSANCDLKHRAFSTGTTDRRHEATNLHASPKPIASVYLCVDRHGTEADLVEQLAKTVASNPVLRKYTEGITVGLADHQRAAPALEATVEAILVGSRDRRNASNSLIGVVAPHPDHLLGLQDPTITDAAQGVQQKLIVAEWNGQGNLKTFANRAHTVWRIQHNLPIMVSPPSSSKRKLPRRIRAQNLRPNWDFLYDCLTAFVVLFYLLFHYGRSLVDYLR